jgi:hypothetical protein
MSHGVGKPSNIVLCPIVVKAGRQTYAYLQQLSGLGCRRVHFVPFTLSPRSLDPPTYTHAVSFTSTNHAHHQPSVMDAPSATHVCLLPTLLLAPVPTPQMPLLAPPMLVHVPASLLVVARACHAACSACTRSAPMPNAAALAHMPYDIRVPPMPPSARHRAIARPPLPQLSTLFYRIRCMC